VVITIALVLNISPTLSMLSKKYLNRRDNREYAEEAEKYSIDYQSSAFSVHPLLPLRLIKIITFETTSSFIFSGFHVIPV
jgi:hypothetical protein